MTPVKVPTVPCADAAPGQETAATNATAAKDDFDMPKLPRSLGDQPATESVDANMASLTWNWAVIPTAHAAPDALPAKPSHGPAAAPFSDYLKRHSKARECRNAAGRLLTHLGTPILRRNNRNHVGFVRGARKIPVPQSV